MTVTCARCDREGQGTPDNLPAGWINQVSTLSDKTFPVCDSCDAKSDRKSVGTGDHAADQLRLLIERIERLEEEKKGISDDIKDVYLEAKSTGYDIKVMREIVRRRRMDGHALKEFEGILETYQAALGMD